MAISSLGYTALTISNALCEIYDNSPSEGAIKKYATAHKLSRPYTTKKGNIINFIPEANLEKLLSGMEIPVRTNDLVECLYGTRCRNIADDLNTEIPLD